MIHIESYILLKEYQTNTYLLFDDVSKEAYLIDPAFPALELLKTILDRQLEVKLIINTHGHGDHIGGNDFFAGQFGCGVAIHADDAGMLTDDRKNLSLYMGTELKMQKAKVLLYESSELKLGSEKVKVIHTPGHTRGSICLLVQNYLISGDTLFEQSIGRTDFPGGDHGMIISSIKNKLFTLPDEVIVYPGHGPVTSIGLEKATNPFVRG